MDERKENAVFSVKELSDRWGVSENTIRNMVSDGSLTPLPIFKTYKFSIHHILELEGVNEVNPLSPLERRRLEAQNQKLQKRVDQLEGVLHEIVAKTCLFVAGENELMTKQAR